MVKEMGKGIRDIELSFENPITVSRRHDEGLLTPANFTNPKKAQEEDYPEGAFGYSQILPMTINFHRPLQFASVFLK
jgi:hypothetical protein